MNVLRMLALHPGVLRLGSTLLHFLWQGVAIAAVYAAARRRAARSSPNLRYLLGCTALAAMAAAPLLTWSVLSSPAAGVGAASPASLSPLASGAVHSLPAPFPARLPAATAAPFLCWVVAAWLAGAAVLWVRLIGGWILAARLRSRMVCPAPAAWQQTLNRLKVRMRVSVPVRLLVSSLVQAPAVVGWIRPLVLAPVGALAGMPPEQMEALLLHELAHIRRCDYLVNMLQCAVEALLFYHPAVWWVSSHMRAERELCCDDAAVAASGDAVAYARALAELALFRPRVAMAANGGSLAQRIGRLLGQSPTAPRSFSGAGVLSAAVLPVIAAVALFGQPVARPTIEVASIKPGEGQGPTGLRPRPGGLTATGSLKMLMLRAYAVQSFQIVGGAEWTNSEPYVVDAKAAGNPGGDQISRMLQSLLEDRFQLKVHGETRELPVFNLVIAKGGPKLPSPKEGGCLDSADPAPQLSGGRMPPPGSGPPPLIRCGGLGITLEKGGVRMFGGKVALSELARVLSPTLGRKVIDKTGLTGLFDIRLDFVADDSTALLPPLPPDAAGDATSPPIFSALPEQLGLRLEASKGPVEVVVIDHVERPSAN